MTPLFSVITVNYNGLELTSALLRSLERHITAPYEVVVVDNGSRNDEAGELRRRHPGAKVIRSERNLGFAGGNNLGIRAATGRYLLLLNNDTEVEDDTLHYLAATLDAHPTAAAVCPKIRFFAPPRPIQFAGYTSLTRFTLRNALVGFGQPDDGTYDTPHETPYIHGAAVMVRREAIDRFGYMPECYFLYYEELDWSERFRAHGYTLLYDPRCTVYHKESATTGQDSPLRTYYLTRNRLLFASRNRGGAVRIAALLYQLTLAAPKNALRVLLRGRRDLAGAVGRGVRDFFRLNDKTV